MDLLHEWLGPTVEAALDKVLIWKRESEANRAQLMGQLENLNFDDDGSNLRIRSAKKQLGQIIKHYVVQTPQSMCLSDSVNRVDAIVSDSAVQKYTNKTGKRFTDGTIGGLIQLINFEVVATHLGPKQKRITLFVTDFHLVGSNTSCGFGIPQAIQDRPKCKDLLQQLTMFRGQEAASSQTSKHHFLSNVPMSQPDSIASQINSPQDTQNMFATQAPFTTKFPADYSPKEGNSTDDFYVDQQKSLPKAPQAKISPLLSRKKLPETRAADLLRLLPPNKKSLRFKITPEEPIKQSMNLSTTKTKDDVFPRRLDLPSPSQVVAPGGSDRPGQPSLLTSKSNPSEGFVERNLSEGTTSVRQTERNRNEVMKSNRSRISSREVRISKEQEKLLNSIDSWLPTEPGRRGPVSNLPISVLQSLNREADLRAQGRGIKSTGEAPRNERGTSLKDQRGSTTTDDHSTQQESESDAPFSPNEWPPSPAPNQLPPDSSAESLGVQPNSKAHVRRLSNASNSSRGTRSRSPTPLQVRRPLRNSVEPSTLAISPSDAPSPDIQASERNSPIDTPKSSASRVSTVMPTGTPLADSRNLSPNASYGQREEGNDRDHERHAEVNVHDARPQIVEGPSSTVNTLSNELKSGHEDQRQKSPQTTTTNSSVNLASLTKTIVEDSHRHKASPSIYSIPSSPDSDLEMVAPLSLNDKTLQASGTSHSPFPSTASQSTEPFTQVKRTPYVNGQRLIFSPPKVGRQASPLKSNASYPSTNGVPGDEVDHVTQSTPSVMDLSKSEGFSSDLKDVANGNGAEETLATIEAIPGEQTHIMPLEDDSGTQSDDLDLRWEANCKSDALEDSSTALSIQWDVPNAATTENNADSPGADGAFVAKRKVSSVDSLSENVAKRRKRFKVPKTFPVMETKVRPDPADAARRYRQEFMVSRRNSEYGKPLESPTTVLVIPCAVNPRDGDTSVSDDMSMSLEDPNKILALDQSEYPDFSDLGEFVESKHDDLRSMSPTGHRGDSQGQSTDLDPKDCSPSSASDGKTHVNGTGAQLEGRVENHYGNITTTSNTGEHRSAAESTVPPAKPLDVLNEPSTKMQDGVVLEDVMNRTKSPAPPDSSMVTRDTQTATPVLHSVNPETIGAGSYPEHDHPNALSADNTKSGAQDMEIISHQATSGRNELGDQAMDVDVADVSSNTQDDPDVAHYDIQHNEHDKNMTLGNGLARLDLTHDKSTDIETFKTTSVVPEPPVEDSAVSENGLSKFDKESIEAADIASEISDVHTHDRSPDIGKNSTSSAGPNNLPTIQNQEDSLQDNREKSPASHEPKYPSLGTSQDDLNAFAVEVGTAQPASVASEDRTRQHQTYESPDLASSKQMDRLADVDQSELRADVPMSHDEVDAGHHAGHQSVIFQRDEQDVLQQAAEDTVMQTPTSPPESALGDQSPEAPSASRSIFDQFKAAYPVYNGDLKHFVAVCKKIETLSKANGMLHQFLWDDYIVRHKMEYAEHLRQCVEDAEDAMTYQEFYRRKVPVPKYCKTIITMENLDLVLCSKEVKSIVLVQRNLNKSDSEAKLPRTPGLVQDTSTVMEELSARPKRPSERRETIDLTLDDQDDVIKVSDEMSKTPPMASIPQQGRSIPSVEAGASPQMTGSRKFRRPIASSTSTPRSLPWMEVEASSQMVDLGTSGRPTASISQAQKATPPMEAEASPQMAGQQHRGRSSPNPFHVNSRARNSNEPLESVEYTSRSSGFGRLSNADKPHERPVAAVDVHDATIRAAWGVGANEVLESNYYDKLTRKRSKILAHISSKIELDEARRLITTRIMDRHNRDPQGAPPKLTTADLEYVLEEASERMVLDRAFPVATPAQANTNCAGRRNDPISTTDLEYVENVRPARNGPHRATQQHEQDEAGQWWQDNNTPFKSFAKAYTSIKPGNGNSFAADYPAKPKGEISRRPSHRQKSRAFDPMDWEL